MSATGWGRAGRRMSCIDTQRIDRFAGEAKDGAGTLLIDDETSSLLPLTLPNPHQVPTTPVHQIKYKHPPRSAATAAALSP